MDILGWIRDQLLGFFGLEPLLKMFAAGDYRSLLTVGGFGNAIAPIMVMPPGWSHDGNHHTAKAAKEALLRTQRPACATMAVATASPGFDLSESSRPANR